MPKLCRNTMNRPAYLLGVEDPGLLGPKVTMIPFGVSRPIPDLHETAPQAFPDAHDIGHFDVTAIRQVLAKAHRVRDEERIDAEDCRDVASSNAVRLHGGMKPTFFEGTAVAGEATRGLATT